MSEATACSVCDEDPCVSGCTVRVPLIRLYMAIGTAQSGGHHADAAVMSRAIESHDGNSESVWIPGPVDEVVRRYGDRTMTCDHAKRCGDCFTAERVAALEAENADLIRRVREAEARAETAQNDRVRSSMNCAALRTERDAALAALEAMRVERDALVAAASEVTMWDWTHLLVDHVESKTVVTDVLRLEAALREHGKGGT